MLITIEFAHFHIMYFLVIKTITFGPARNSHTRWVYFILGRALLADGTRLFAPAKALVSYQ